MPAGEDKSVSCRIPTEAEEAVIAAEDGLLYLMAIQMECMVQMWQVVPQVEGFLPSLAELEVIEVAAVVDSVEGDAGSENPPTRPFSCTLHLHLLYS